MSDYAAFLASKQTKIAPIGIEIDPGNIHPLLFPFQRDLTAWAIRKGRAAIFADTGLGKTFMQLEWARLLGKRTLIIAPLSVARQTVREARKIDLDVHYVRDSTEVKQSNLLITNYELIQRFDFGIFGAVILDESSILKALTGKTRQRLTDLCGNIPYRLCCTATPAPNDYTELGNHVEFLGICSRAEMLAMFFVNANKEHTYYFGEKAYWRKGSNKGGQEWRLKHHAEQPFFRWLSSWSIALMKPSDLGYEDAGFLLPALNIKPYHVRTPYYKPDDRLFFTHIRGIREASRIRRHTISERLEKLQEIIGNPNEQWIIWTGLQEEADRVTDILPSAIQVKGSHSPDYKCRIFEEFQDGKHQILVTKPRIGGFGMNFQNAHNMAFFGLGYSWEQFYQCIRRQWRFGQTDPVNVHIVMSEIEDGIYRNVMRKDAAAKRLRTGLIEQVRAFEQEELAMSTESAIDHTTDRAEGAGWQILLGDSCERLQEIQQDSIDLSVYSPPFADLYTYTDSERDLGNCRGWDEFFQHYAFIIREVLRVTKPGRLCCVHTSDIPAMANRDGYIGIKNFPGRVIEAHQGEGWTFVGRAFVPKNPQAQAIRVKSKALLFVQLRKDSTASRPALIDQILLFKKPGENKVPVIPVANGELDNETWIIWANGVWHGIRETETLQYYNARDTGDEKHICPLQLETIERCITLWSNPGELVLSPFAGIGSELYQAVKMGRRATGIELKQSYFDIAVKNLERAESVANIPNLFEFAGIEV